MSKYNMNDRVRIKHNVSRSGQYGRHRGELGKITGIDRWGNSIQVTLDTGKVFRNVGKAIIELIGEDAEEVTNDNNDITRESLETRKKKLEKALKRVNTKLEFLDATDSNIFSEKLFRAHQIVRLASSTEVDEKERAELIAEFL